MNKTMERRIATVEAIRKLQAGEDGLQWYTCPAGADVIEFTKACEMKAAGRHFTMISFLGPHDPRPKPHHRRTDIVLEPNAAFY